jgi:hypothetical protein
MGSDPHVSDQIDSMLMQRILIYGDVAWLSGRSLILMYGCLSCSRADIGFGMFGCF